MNQTHATASPCTLITTKTSLGVVFWLILRVFLEVLASTIASIDHCHNCNVVHLILPSYSVESFSSPIQKEHSFVKHIDSHNLDARHLNQLNDPIAAALPVEAGLVQPAAPPPANLQPRPVVNPPKAPPDDLNREESAEKNHGTIGLALTTGFVIMFLVDHLGTTACCRACARPLLPIFQCICCRRQSNDALLRK